MCWCGWFCLYHWLHLFDFSPVCVSNAWIRGWLWYMWVVALISECGHHPAWLPLLIISRRHTINDTFPIGHMNAQCTFTLYMVSSFCQLVTKNGWLVIIERVEWECLKKIEKKAKRDQNVKEAQSRLACHAWCCATLLGKTLRDSSYQSLSALWFLTQWVLQLARLQ